MPTLPSSHKQYGIAHLKIGSDGGWYRAPRVFNPCSPDNTNLPSVFPGTDGKVYLIAIRKILIVKNPYLLQTFSPAYHKGSVWKGVCLKPLSARVIGYIWSPPTIETAIYPTPNSADAIPTSGYSSIAFINPDRQPS